MYYTITLQLPAKEANPQLAMGPSGRGFGDSPTCEVGVAGLILGKTNYERACNGPGYHFMVSQPSLNALEQN